SALHLGRPRRRPARFTRALTIMTSRRRRMTTGPTGDTDNAAGNGGGPTPTPPPPPAPAPSPAPAPVDVWATDPQPATALPLAATLGAREKARNAAVDASKDWAARFADWAAPGDTIDKLVSAYLGQIDKLNADINNEVAADTAILSFWAEIAPRHLQVSDVAL